MSTYAEELFTPRAEHADEFATAALGVVETLPLGSRVLDIGCGSGDLIRRANRPGIAFIGVDISRPNIEAAMANSPGAEFHWADFLTFSAEPFDAVLANSVLHLIGCPDGDIIAALAKSLKPGGVLVTAMPIDSAKNRTLSHQRRVWNMMPPWIDRLIASAASPLVRDNSIIERIVYLRAAPTRMLGTSFISAMEHGGFHLSAQVPMASGHVLKLDHAIATWRYCRP